MFAALAMTPHLGSSSVASRAPPSPACLPHSVSHVDQCKQDIAPVLYKKGNSPAISRYMAMPLNLLRHSSVSPSLVVTDDS